MLSRLNRSIFCSSHSQPNLPISRRFSCMKGSTKISSCWTSKPSTSPDDGSRFPATEGGELKQLPASREFAVPDKRKDRPSVNVGANSRHRSKRRIRIDLGSEPDKIMDRGVEGTRQQKDDFSVPTSFGKKRVPFAPERPVTRGTRTPPRGKPKDASPVEASNANEQFDICLSDSSELAETEPLLDDDYTEEQLVIDHSIVYTGQVLRSGMVLLKNYIHLNEQVEIVKKCQELGLGRGGFYQPRFQNGAKLRLHMMCLGMDWDPQAKRYGKRRQHDGSEPPDIPPCFRSLVSRALQDSYALIRKNMETRDVEDILPQILPDICILNFYSSSGRLGLHQDSDESEESLHKGLPVVSVSIGDSAEFLYGDERDVNKAESVILESGDVLLFGGRSRHIFHGVASILPDTAPPPLIANTRIRPGRLNLTFRQF